MELIELKHERIYGVRREMYAKQWVYAAEDSRGTALIVAQRMRLIQIAIDKVCGEDCSLASLFESAADKLVKGKTGSFYVKRMPAADLPAYVDAMRGHYERVIIAARNSDKWILEPAGATTPIRSRPTQ